MRTTEPTAILHVGYSHTLGCIARDLLVGLKRAGWTIHAACPGDEWAANLREDGLTVWPIRFPHRPGPRETLRGARDLHRTLRTCRFAAVHTHNAHHGIVGRHLGHVLGLPVFHTWRYDPLDAASNSFSRLVYGIAEGSASRVTRAVMFQNEEDLEVAVKRRIVPRARAVLVGNGIVTERYEKPNRPRDEVRRELGIDDRAKVIACVARLAERKGQPDLVEALQIVASEHPDVQLLLVGNGPDEDDIRSCAERVGVASRLHFLGQREDIPDILHASDVLCLPSRREGVPRAIMEAMAARVPVVATDVVGTRSLVQDGRSGYLAPYRDPPALARALARVLGNAELAASVTATAAETVRRDWHQQAVVDRVGREYERFIRRATARNSPRVPRNRETASRHGTHRREGEGAPKAQ